MTVTLFSMSVSRQTYTPGLLSTEKKFIRVAFTAKYNVSKLVYYETFYSIEEAIDREKQIKTYSRIKKIELIVGFNPEWNDLYETVKYW